MVLRIPLNDGSFALVDDEDVWALDYTWAVRDDESRMVYALKPHPPGGKVLRRIKHEFRSLSQYDSISVPVKTWRSSDKPRRCSNSGELKKITPPIDNLRMVMYSA